MKKSILFVLLLGACAPQQNPVADSQRACVAIDPIVQATSTIPDAKVQSIISHANAVCGPLASGIVPPTVDSKTPAWLGSLAGMLKVLVPVAASLL